MGVSEAIKYATILLFIVGCVVGWAIVESLIWLFSNLSWGAK